MLIRCSNFKAQSSIEFCGSTEELITGANYMSEKIPKNIEKYLKIFIKIDMKIVLFFEHQKLFHCINNPIKSFDAFIIISALISKICEHLQNTVNLDSLNEEEHNLREWIFSVLNDI